MAQPWTSAASASLVADGTPVTLVHESAFCLSDLAGDVRPGTPHGFIYRDTRFLSTLVLRCNDRAPQPLDVAVTEPFAALFSLQDQAPPGRADAHLLLLRRRFVGRGMREDLELRNYGTEPAPCRLELDVDADFADLFDVKEGRARPAGTVDRRRAGGAILLRYAREGFERATRLSLDGAEVTDRGFVVEVTVPPGGTWRGCLQVVTVFDGEPVPPAHRCGRPVARSAPTRQMERWRSRLPRITAEHDSFAALVGRSAEDLAALRIFDPEHPERSVVAAGAPWFMTLFGRDALLTSWMAMLVDPGLALGTLQTLAEHQGRRDDPRTEEQPGRILHEIRFGERSVLALGGARIYYGSVDATPLFVMLTCELRRWLGGGPEVDALLEAADAALAWVETCGDPGGTGFTTYERRSPHGLVHQGWKDSWDGIRFSDGRVAEPPVALCEVQGYVYAALVGRAYCALELGDRPRAAALLRRAEDLKRRFNEAFWMPDREAYALGLDREGRRIDALASNMGHCLWTGIVEEERAPAVVRHLLSPELFSGWGVRTLGAGTGGWNPLGYHTGSVWPHDNALVAAGLMRYGFVEEAHRVIDGIVAAAPHFGLRLPELFSGLDRAETEQPVRYPTSCSPQAWAAAAPLLFLRTLLRLEPDLHLGRIHLAPVVPASLGRLRLEGVRVFGGRLSLEAEGERVDLVEAPAGVEVRTEPRVRTLGLDDLRA
jgi:glycogen debranching enzyme